MTAPRDEPIDDGPIDDGPYDDEPYDDEPEYWGPFRGEDGGVRMGLDPTTVRSLREMFAGIAGAITDDHELVARLFPTAYPHDAEFEAGYQVLARSELADRRIADLASASELLDAERLDDEQLACVARSLNSLRLVIAAQLGIEHDDTPPPLEEDPAFGVWVVYEDLGDLVNVCVQLLSTRL